jgi:hypothetical protein
MTETFDDRMLIGLSHELTVAEVLRAMGCKVQPFGRGEWSHITEQMQNRVVTLRHAPDMIVARDGRFGLVDCKSSDPKYLDSPNLVIEAESLTALMKWSHMLDIPAIVVWHDMTWDHVDTIDAIPAKTLYTDGKGSRTPYWLIRRSDLSGQHLSVLDRDHR